MELKEKMRVKVNSPFGVGFGWIEHISDFFYCPVQVKLDEPSYDGHSLMRFDFAELEPVMFLQPVECLWPEEVEPQVELTKEPEKVEVEPEAVEVEPKKEKPPINMLVQLANEIKGYSFKKGDVFAASEVGTKYNSCYYLYDPVTFKLRGCMIKEAFHLLYTNLSAAQITDKFSIMDFVEKSIAKRIETEREKVKEQPKKHKTVTKIVKPDPPVKEVQMSLFDF
jgi:hypothetical protein